MKAGTAMIQGTDILQRLNQLLLEMSAIREALGRVPVRPVSSTVTEWVARVNAAINDPTLEAADRTRIINRIPAPLRHAVAVECYRTNENVTLGWAATIAGILVLEAPELLRAHGIEPELTTDMGVTAREMDNDIAVLVAEGMLKH